MARDLEKKVNKSVGKEEYKKGVRGAGRTKRVKRSRYREKKRPKDIDWT